MLHFSYDGSINGESSAVRHGAFIVDPELSGLFTNWSRKACARILARHGAKIDRFEGR